MLSLGILSWRAHKTLRKTLETLGALLPLVDEAVIFFNEITDADREIAKEFGFRAEGSPTNLGILGGDAALMKVLKGDQVLYVQNDCPICVPPEVVKRRVLEASEAVASGKVQYVMMRHRLPDELGGRLKFFKYYPREGEATTLQQRLNRLLRPCKARRMRGRSIWAYQHPEEIFPEIYQRQGELNLTSSKHLNFSEQPFLAATPFALALFDYCEAHRNDKHTLDNGQPTAEIILNGSKWWRGRDIPIAASDGIFAHERFDDSFRASDKAFNPNLDASI